MKKSLNAAAVFGAAAALMLMGAPAANAAPPADLPAAQDLYVIDCETLSPQLWRVAPDGSSTPIGDAYLTATGDGCAGGGQRDQTTGISYFIYYPGGPVSQLATVDLTTGEVVIIGTISGATTGAWQFFITNDGTAYITNADLFTIDLTTAVTTLVAPITPLSPPTMGYNPVNDTIYAIDRDDVMAVYTVNRLTGVLTDTGFTGTWPTGNCLGGGSAAARPDGIVFDTAGFAWIQSDSCNSSVMAVDLSDGSATAPNQLFDSTATLYPVAPNDFYSETFIIGPDPLFVPAPDPALAATGVDSDAVLITGTAAAVTAVLGLVLLARNRRRTA